MAWAYWSGKKETPFDFGNALYVKSNQRVIIPADSSLDFTSKDFTILAWTFQKSIEAPTTWATLVANWDGIIGNQAWSMQMGNSTPFNNNRIRNPSTLFQSGTSGSANNGYAFDLLNFRAYQKNLADNFMKCSDGRINLNDYTAIWSSLSMNAAAIDYVFTGKYWELNANIGSFGGVANTKYYVELLFFDYSLTESEIEFLHNFGNFRNPLYLNPVCWLDFNESAGTAIASSAESPGSPASRLIIDKSGNGNHAYATGYVSGDVDFVPVTSL